MGPLAVAAVPAITGLIGKLFGKNKDQNNGVQGSDGLSGIASLGLQFAPALMGLFGNMMDKKRRGQQEDKASAGFSQLTDLLRGQLNQDYFDSTEAMGAMKAIDQNADNFLGKILGTANVNGLTDEARIALMGKNIGAKQQAYTGLSRNADLWRQRALQNYQGSLGQLFEAGMTNRGMFQNSLNNIVGGAQKAIDGATSTGAFDKLFAGKKEYTGANPDIEASKYLWG